MRIIWKMLPFAVHFPNTSFPNITEQVKYYLIITPIVIREIFIYTFLFGTQVFSKNKFNHKFDIVKHTDQYMKTTKFHNISFGL